jgi:hypothetical protein
MEEDDENAEISACICALLWNDRLIPEFFSQPIHAGGGVRLLPMPWTMLSRAFFIWEVFSCTIKNIWTWR